MKSSKFETLYIYIHWKNFKVENLFLKSLTIYTITTSFSLSIQKELHHSEDE